MMSRDAVVNYETAMAWLATWGGRPRKGILGAAIDGTMKAWRIMDGARGRYSVDQIADQREAASALKMAYRNLFGSEYVAR